MKGSGTAAQELFATRLARKVLRFGRSFLGGGLVGLFVCAVVCLCGCVDWDVGW